MKPSFIVVTLMVLLSSAASLAQQGDISYKATQVAPGIVMLEGDGGFAGGNIGLWIGDDGVVLIDDGLEPLYSTLLDAVRKHVGKPIDYVINTHVHGDHTGNNAGLSKAGATIIAHDNIRHRMLAKGKADGQQAVDQHMLPELTFSDELTLHLNGQNARLIHVSAAHTDGDSIIHFPEADVIHCGDILFNGMFPFIDLNSAGSVDGYIAALERILALAGTETKIIAGHGPLATKQDVQASLDMIVDARSKVAKLVRAGNDEEAIVKANPLATLEKWSWAFITTERFTRTLVKDGAN